MKRYLFLVLLLTVPLHAQFTNVTATVTSLQTASYTWDFINQAPSGGPPLLGGISVFPTQLVGSFDGSGHMSVSLATNSQVLPLPSQWKLNVVMCKGNPSGPLGFSLQVTVAGTTQDITTQLTSAIPPIPPTCNGGGGGGGGGGSGNVIPSPQFQVGFFPQPGSMPVIQGVPNSFTSDVNGNIRTRSLDGLFNAFGNQSSPGSNNGIQNSLQTSNSFVIAGPDYASTEAVYGTGVCPFFRLAIGCPAPFANGTELFDYRPGTIGSYLYNPNMVAEEFQVDRVVSNVQAQASGSGVDFFPFRTDFEISGSGKNGFPWDGGPDSFGQYTETMELMRAGIGSWTNVSGQNVSIGDFHALQFAFTNNRGNPDGDAEGFQFLRFQVDQNISPVTVTANGTTAAGAILLPGTLVSADPFTADQTIVIDATKGGPIKHIVSMLGPGATGTNDAGQWTVDGTAMTPDNFGRVAAAILTPTQYYGATTNMTVTVTGLSHALSTASTVCVASHDYTESAAVVNAGSFGGGTATGVVLALMYPHDVNSYVVQGFHSCNAVSARANELPNGTSFPGRQVFWVIGADGAQTYRYSSTGAGNWQGVPTGFFSTAVVAPPSTTITRNGSNVASISVTDPGLIFSGIQIIVSGCSDATFNGQFITSSDTGTVLSWPNTGGATTTTCTNSIEILSLMSGHGVREIQEFPASLITSSVDPATNANNLRWPVQPNTNLQVTAGDQLEDHVWNQISQAERNVLINFQMQTSPSLGQVMRGIQLSEFIPEGITIDKVTVQESASHYFRHGGTKPVGNILFDMGGSTTPFLNLYNLTAPEGTVFNINNCSFACTDSRSKFNLFTITQNGPQIVESFDPSQGNFHTDIINLASQRFTEDKNPLDVNWVLNNSSTASNILVWTASQTFDEVLTTGGVSLTMTQTSTTFSLAQAGASGIPTFQLVGMANGCATFSSGVLGSTGSACGSGGGSPLTTKGDLFGFSTVAARVPVGTNGQVLTSDSTNANGVSWQAAGTGTVTSFAAPSGSWPTWLVPTVTNSTTTPSLAVAASAIPNSALANSATTVNGQTCTLGSTCTVGVAWSALTNPTGNLSLTMAADTSTFTYNATTGSSDMWKITDTASNTGTGILFHVTTAGSSLEIPWQADAAGIGWKVDAVTGNFVGVGSSASHGMVLPEGTPIAGVGGSDVLTTNSITHRLTMNNNNGGALPVAGIIASGTIAVATGAISSATCATTTVSVSGVLSTDAVIWNANGSLSAVTGYVPSTSGGLTLAIYPTSGHLSVDNCNWTSGSITPGAVTLNFTVTR